MVTIYEITTGKVVKMSNANSSCSDSESICTNSKVGNVFRRNWKGVVDYFIDCGSFFQLLLSDNYRVKGKDKEEEAKFQRIFGWTW